jgi:hypothetical protein
MPDFRCHTRCGHEELASATGHVRPIAEWCIHPCYRLDLLGNRSALASEGGLINLKSRRLDDPAIRRNVVTGLDDAGHQSLCQYLYHLAVAADLFRSGKPVRAILLQTLTDFRLAQANCCCDALVSQRTVGAKCMPGAGAIASARAPLAALPACDATSAGAKAPITGQTGWNVGWAWASSLRTCAASPWQSKPTFP